MKFKEFRAWCRERGRDGYWDVRTCLFCIETILEVKEQPFWKREKKWQELNACGKIEKHIVTPINQKIAKLRGGK